MTTPPEGPDDRDPAEAAEPSQAPGQPGTSEPSEQPEQAHSELSEDEKQEELRRFNMAEQNSAWKAVAYLITGPLIYGGLGALLDHWLGTSWLVGAGIVGGMALSLYLIWFRYGTH